MANNPETPLNRKHLSRMEREVRQRQIILAVTIGISVLVVGLLVAALVDQFIITPRRAVAKVGAENISFSELEKAVTLRRYNLLVQARQYQIFGNILGDQFGQQYLQQAQSLLAQATDSRALGQSVLNEKVENTILLQEAAARGITVSDEEVSEEIQTRFRYYPNGTPTPEPSETPVPTASPTEGATPTATATLAPSTTPTEGPAPTATPTATPYTEELFQKDYNEYVGQITQYTGMSEAEFRETVHKELLIQKVRDALRDEATIEADKKEASASHILFNTQNLDDTAKANVKTQAEEVLKRALAGEDFAALAKEFSEDSGSKENGGALGSFSTGQMVAPFETAVFGATQTGVLPTLVESEFGYHIINVTAVAATVPLTESEKDAKKDSAAQAWVDAKKEETIQYDWWFSKSFSRPSANTLFDNLQATDSFRATETEKFAPTSTSTPENFDVTQTAEFEATATSFNLTISAVTATAVPLTPVAPSTTP